MTPELHTAAAIIFGTLGIGFAGFILRWAWTHTHKRIDDCVAYAGKAVDDLYKTKASNDELTRVRDAQLTIFDKIASHESADSMTHSRIMESLGEIKGKVDTLLMRKRGGE